MVTHTTVTSFSLRCLPSQLPGGRLETLEDRLIVQEVVLTTIYNCQETYILQESKLPCNAIMRFLLKVLDKSMIVLIGIREILCTAPGIVILKFYYSFILVLVERPLLSNPDGDFRKTEAAFIPIPSVQNVCLLHRARSCMGSPTFPCDQSNANHSCESYHNTGHDE